jgi:hypothetical protein
MTTLIKYTKTENQESKLLTLAFSENFKRVTSRPTLTNKNLLVRLTDSFGRESFNELTPQGKLINTLIWF